MTSLLNDDSRNKLLHIWIQQAVGICNTAAGEINARFNNAQEVYECDDFSFLGEKRGKIIARLMNKSTENAFEVLKKCKSGNINITGFFDSDYPKKLKVLADMPVVLYSIGAMRALDGENSIAIVGTRNASETGKQTAFRFARDLAESRACIISGLALGIDASAHEGALAAGGYTVGVLGCPIGNVYPKENAELYDALYKKGLVVSELYPGAPRSRGDFPNRNRIISALSDSVIVVEAGEHSGALITARHAKRQNKALYAVLCNNAVLTELGARFVGSADEVTDRMPHGAKPCEKADGSKSVICRNNNGHIHKKNRIVLKLKEDLRYDGDGSQEENRLYNEMIAQRAQSSSSAATTTFSGENSKPILKLLAEGRPFTTDEICYRTGLPITAVMIELTYMEIDGLITSMAGDRYILKVL